jgi:hypothetical protein
MRGSDQRRDGLFSYVRPDSRIPNNHPLRVIRRLADAALAALNKEFAALYSENGRATAARFIAASVVLDPVGTPPYGTTELQPIVPLVRRSVRR